MYTLLLAVIYLAFISLGLPDSLLGAGWPGMHEALQVPVSHMGIVTMVISGCTVVSSLASDALTRRWKTHVVTTVSVFLSALSLFGFSRATQFWMLIACAIPYGLSAGSIDAALNNYVALHYSSRHMSWLHCFWGVGTIVSPFVMSRALSGGVWQDGYTTIALLQAGIGVALLAALPLWRVNKPRTAENGEAKSVGLVGALKIRGVPCLLLGFFGYCAAEATVMGWASTYLTEVRGMAAERAAAFGSLFFIGLTAGRFVAGFLTDRLGDRRMIRLGTAVSLAGMACILIPAASEMLALAGFVVIGLGFAPIYPCIIHATPDNFGAEHSGAIIGIQMASAYAGSTFMPPVYGVIGKAVGFGVMPVYLIAFTALMIVMVERTFGMTKKEA